MDNNLFNEEDDFTTPGEVLKQMSTVWRNEISSPHLLPTQMDQVDILLDQIQGMEEDIARQKEKMSLRISLHRFELQRISYITSDYMRCRLRKIESNPFQTIEAHKKRSEEGMSELLSEQELKFAQAYAKNETELYEKTALEDLPVGLRKIQVPTADISEEMVYAHVLSNDVGNVSIPDWTDMNSEVVIEMQKNAIHLIPYHSIKNHVEGGTVNLL